MNDLNRTGFLRDTSTMPPNFGRTGMPDLRKIPLMVMLQSVPIPHMPPGILTSPICSPLWARAILSLRA